LLGNGANRVALLVEVSSHALAVSTHAACYIDTVIRVTDGAEALRDRRSLLGEALVLVASGCHCLLDRPEAGGLLWGAARTTLCRLVGGVVAGIVPPRARRFRLGDRLLRRPLFDPERS
jgi:hypothetical protein